MRRYWIVLYLIGDDHALDLRARNALGGKDE